MPVAPSPERRSRPALRRWRWSAGAALALAAGGTLVLLLWLTGFFSFGRWMPQAIDINPAMLDSLRLRFPPHGVFFTDYWLGQTRHAVSLQPLSLVAWWPMWLFFTGVYPVFAALAIPAAYLFLRELEFSRAASLTAAVFYGWQGELFSTLLAGHFPAPIMWALLPLSGWLVVLSSRRDDFFLAAAAGVAIGLQVALLPDRGMLCSVLLASFYLVEWIRQWRGGVRRWLRLVGRLAVMSLLALLIALPDLSATLRTLVFEVEAAPVAEEIAEPVESRGFGWATQWSWAPEEAAAYLVPGILGWYQGDEAGPYWGRVGQSESYAETGKGLRHHRLASFTWGTLAVALFLLGMGRFLSAWSGLPPLPRRMRGYLALLLLAGVVGYVLALGKFTPFYAWFYELPGMDTWRNPLKFLMPVSLSFLVFIAVGADSLHRAFNGDFPRARLLAVRLLQGLAAVLTLVWLWAWVGSGPLLEGLARDGYTAGRLEAIVHTLRLSTFLAASTMALAALAAWWLRRAGLRPAGIRWVVNPFLRRYVLAAFRPGRRGTALLVVLVVLNVGQMLWVHSHFVELLRTRDAIATNGMIELLKPRDGERPRVKVMRGDPVLESLLQRGFRYHGVESVDIPAVSRMPSDYRAWFKALGGNPVRWMELSSARYFAMPTPALDRLLRQSEFADRAKSLELFPLAAPTPDGRTSHAVLELSGTLPRAALIPQLDVMPTRKSLLGELSNPEWNPHISVLVDAPTVRELGLLEMTAKKIPTDTEYPVPQIVAYSGRRIVVRTEAPYPATLLLTDRFDPGWSATVNGEPSPVFPANYLLRGVRVPAGTAEVVLTFRSPVNAVYLQLVTWACFLVAGALWWWRHRGRGLLAPPEA